jgi:CDP-diacylglycerol--glycerol-3-phosphate 3-phosphatidyltransferase
MYAVVKARQMTIPNWISLYRILIAPVLLVVIFANNLELFKWLILISFGTDILDGYVARTFNMKSEIGTLLDSIGDMVTNGIAALGILIFFPEFVYTYIIPISLMVFFYCFEIVLSLWRYGYISSFHTYMCKTASVAQGIFVLSLLFFGFNPWIFWPTVIISITANVEEIIIVLLYRKWQTNVKGLYWLLTEDN